MPSLIVNADDFGLTAGVNRAIIEAHTRGIVTSTTVMVNMPAFAQAAELARSHPSLGVGLHFNIAQGKPVAPVEQVRSLLNRRDEFPGTSTEIAWRMITGGLKIAEIIIELRAQIERALRSGIRLTHIDSHKHSHALPQVLEAIIQTIPDYGIRAVRLQREQWRPDMLAGSVRVAKQGAVSLLLSQLCRAGESRLRQSGLRTTQSFFGITHTGFWTKEWLNRLIEQLPEGVSELMCHPGYADAEIHRAATRLVASREQEYHLLTDPEILAAIHRHAVKLVNYTEV
jgi:hopanoid biosynthesis associated protein HpnK